MPVLDLSMNRILTRRLVLRPLRAGDDARVFELFANWNVVRFLSAPPWPYSREDAHAFVQLRIPPEQTDSITFAITHQGCADRLHRRDQQAASEVQRDGGYNLGYWLGEPFWGEGCMSEAARALRGACLRAEARDEVSVQRGVQRERRLAAHPGEARLPPRR